MRGFNVLSAIDHSWVLVPSEPGVLPRTVFHPLVSILQEQ